MKNPLSMSLLFIVGFTTATVLANKAPSPPAPTTIVSAPTNPAQIVKPMSSILHGLQTAGYENVYKIELTHGFYTVNTLDADGHKVSLKIDATTGVIPVVPVKEDTAKLLTLAEAVQKVETAGYHYINKAEWNDGKYELKALAANGKKVKLKVDAKTGKVTKKWL